MLPIRWSESGRRLFVEYTGLELCPPSFVWHRGVFKRLVLIGVEPENRTYIAGYALMYDPETDRYLAGCRDFSYAEALGHWNYKAFFHKSYSRARAMHFLDCIERHRAMMGLPT